MLFMKQGEIHPSWQHPPFFWVIFTSTSTSQLFYMFGFPNILSNKIPPKQHDLFEEQKK
jgi:hypothetical protein